MADVDMGKARRARRETPRLRRYLRLGLSTNPFFHTTLADGGPTGEGSEAARALLADPSWKVLEVMGEKGAGKTHLLRWLLARLGPAPGECYRHLPEPARVPGPPAGAVLFALDEAQRADPRDLATLGAWARPPGRRLLVGTHEPRVEALGWDAEDPGVRRVRLDRLDRAEAEAWVRHRLADAAIPGREVDLELTPAAWVALYSVAGENFLRFTDVLYQVGQDLPEDGRVGAAEVAAAAARLDAEG